MKLEDGGILRGFDSGVRQAPEQWLVFAAPVFHIEWLGAVRARKRVADVAVMGWSWVPGK
jgi:hypothetical protein